MHIFCIYFAYTLHIIFRIFFIYLAYIFSIFFIYVSIFCIYFTYILHIFFKYYLFHFLYIFRISHIFHIYKNIWQHTSHICNLYVSHIYAAYMPTYICYICRGIYGIYGTYMFIFIFRIYVFSVWARSMLDYRRGGNVEVQDAELTATWQAVARRRTNWPLTLSGLDEVTNNCNCSLRLNDER